MQLIQREIIYPPKTPSFSWLRFFRIYLRRYSPNSANATHPQRMCGASDKDHSIFQVTSSQEIKFALTHKVSNVLIHVFSKYSLVVVFNKATIFLTSKNKNTFFRCEKNTAFSKHYIFQLLFFELKNRMLGCF